MEQNVAELSQELYQEPSSENERAGLTTWKPTPLAYRAFMEDEGIPIYEGIGVHNIRNLDLGDWARLGARGAFLYLDGLEGLKGMHVLEVPGGGFTEPERHLYHEFYLVIEGHGSAEVWRHGGSGRRQLIEWGPGALFYFPPNMMHRLVNGSRDRALLLAANNAPPVMNTLRDREFIFENDYVFKSFYSDGDDFYDFSDRIYQTPTNHRAQMRANYYPDVINVQLPLDNARAPG